MLKAILLDENFLKAIISSLLLISLGFVLRYAKIVGNKTKQVICFIVLKISLPALAFTAFLSDFDQQKFKDDVIIFILSLVFFIVLLAIGNLIFRKYGKEKRHIYAIFITVGQLTFFSIPVLKAVYGDEVMIMANMVTFSFRFILYVYCYFIIAKLSFNKENVKTSLKHFLLNPIMIAMFLGLVIWLTQNVMYHITIDNHSYSLFRIDQTLPFLYRILHALQSTSTPLAMLVIGFSLGESKIIDALKDKGAWLCSILRVFIAPLFVLFVLVVFCITKLYSFSELAAASLVIGFAAPLSAVVNTYCLNFKNEAIRASRICFLSTLLCILSIPILYVLIHLFVGWGVFY